MVCEENIESNQTIGCLEELGLSKYESSAYYNLLGKGMIYATEIAYTSGIPRTKIYSVLKKLEKKNLVLISNQKPMMCRAISPHEGFDEVIKKNEKRLFEIKKIISNLQSIDEIGLKSKGIEEKKYFVLNHLTTNNKIIDFIKKSNLTINIMINPWGNKLLIFAKEELIKSIIKGVKIKIILDYQCDLETKMLPDTIEKKISNVHTNTFIFDNEVILIVENSGIKSALIHSNDTFSSIIIDQFNTSWNSQGKEILI